MTKPFEQIHASTLEMSTKVIVNVSPLPDNCVLRSQFGAVAKIQVEDTCPTWAPPLAHTRLYLAISTPRQVLFMQPLCNNQRVFLTHGALTNIDDQGRTRSSAKGLTPFGHGKSQVTLAMINITSVRRFAVIKITQSRQTAPLRGFFRKRGRSGALAIPKPFQSRSIGINQDVVL